MAYLIRADGTRVELGSLRVPRWDGVTIRGIAHRCGHPEQPGEIVELRCELAIGHDGPVMPRWRHVGRDRTGKWHSWEEPH